MTTTVTTPLTSVLHEFMRANPDSAVDPLDVIKRINDVIPEVVRRGLPREPRTLKGIYIDILTTEGVVEADPQFEYAYESIDNAARNTNLRKTQTGEALFIALTLATHPAVIDVLDRDDHFFGDIKQTRADVRTAIEYTIRFLRSMPMRPFA